MAAAGTNILTTNTTCQGPMVAFPLAGSTTQTYDGEACDTPALPARLAGVVPRSLFEGVYSLESAGERDLDNYPLTQNITVATGNFSAVSVIQVTMLHQLLGGPAPGWSTGGPAPAQPVPGRVLARRKHVPHDCTMHASNGLLPSELLPTGQEASSVAALQPMPPA